MWEGASDSKNKAQNVCEEKQPGIGMEWGGATDGWSMSDRNLFPHSSMQTQQT